MYRNQKDDEKRNAANVILLEIRRAEDGLKQLSADSYFFSQGEKQVRLMKTASWDKYKHLFVNDFAQNPTEWNKIADFYELCEEYDTAVRDRNNAHDENQKQLTVNVQKVLADYARAAAEGTIVDGQKVFMDASAYLVERKQFLDVTINPPAAQIDYYIPKKYDVTAKRVVTTIDRNLSTNDAGKLLKRVAAPKNTFWTRLSKAFKNWETP